MLNPLSAFTQKTKQNKQKTHQKLTQRILLVVNEPCYSHLDWTEIQYVLKQIRMLVSVWEFL